MYTITYHPEAEAEYIESYCWYETQQPGLGDKFEIAIEAALQKIMTYPERYSYSETGFRKVLVRGFPFIVEFSLDMAAQNLFIASIFHTSRGPEKKFRTEG